jgi:2,3-bisphosphoglycerate-dependent phosphoglycerate mutase
VLILVRHGQSIYNEQKLMCGTVDVPLTQMGIEQATACGNSLGEIPFDFCYSSTLQRATETARIILETLGQSMGVETTHKLNERSYGVLEGLTLGECRDKFPPKKYKTWERDYFEAPPMGESLSDVSCRVIPYYTHNILPKLRAGRNVLIVSHANVMKVLFGFIRKLEESEIMSIEIENAIPYTFPPGLLDLKGSCAI